MKNPWKVELNDTLMERRRNRIENLEKHPEVQRFLHENHADPLLVEKNSALFEQWLREQERCAKCQGLEFCSSKIRGQSRLLKCEEGQYLSEMYQTCRYQNEQNQKRSNRQNFRFSHMRPEQYEVSLKDLGSAGGRYTKPAAYVDALEASVNGTGLFLYGQAGTGKSTLMMAMANTMAAPRRSGRKTAYVKMPLLIQELKNCISSEPERIEYILNILYRVDVLFIDDLGNEKISQWSRDEILFPLLEERLSAGRMTCFASNSSLEDLQRGYAQTGGPFSDRAAERLVDRIRALARPVEMKGMSFRSR